ncbi:phosphate ABC transporter ATP-binding protein PstB [bacterium]|nr:phosphate ABC transporter ATP-binding protein PstB [bacterium]
MKKNENCDHIKLSVHHLDFFYGKKQVLRKISMDIHKHSITALMGPSGCGKSTFLRVMNRMNDLIPEARAIGTVLLDNEDIYGNNTDVVKLRQRVGMVFQQPNPLPKSIFDNMAYGLRIKGIKDKQKIAELIEKSLKKTSLWGEVKDELHKSALSLSGGQQQRLCIARAIVMEPEMILMDEPCSALDPISTTKIEELMKELVDDYTIVIVTHNMQQAQRVSDWTGFFYMGDLLEFDKTKEIFHHPKEKKTQEYIEGRWG